MRVLISGAGIAGPTLAYWLQRHGHEITIVERAQGLRTGGYIVDFWGTGFDIADAMGLAPELRTRGYRVKEVRLVDRNGRRSGGFDADVFEEMTDGRFVSIPRGELASAIFHTLSDRVEVMFGDEIVDITERGHDVRVAFARAAPRAFDLVVGADGLHSKVRALAFGSQHRYERYLGYKVAAFESIGYRHRDDDVYVMHTEVGRSIGRFAMRGDRTLFLFVFREDEPIDFTYQDVAAQKHLLHERFAGAGWECAEILGALDVADELYFDRVSQIRIDTWARGRVALVGDAAASVSLLAGQGAALAMVEAYVLAGELMRADGDHRVAFDRYHQQLSSFVHSKQESALRFASVFAPRSELRLHFRDLASRLLGNRTIARLSIGRDLADRVRLPSYPAM